MAAPKGAFLYALVFLLPVNRSMNSFRLIWSAILSSSIWCRIILQSAFCSGLLYLRNIPLPRNAGLRTCTSGLHAGRKSSGCFSLWGISWFVIHYTSVGRLSACGCDPDTPTLLWSLPPSAHTASSKFLRYPFWAVRKSPSCGISAQILHGTGNAILYAVGFLSLFLSLKKTLVPLDLQLTDRFSIVPEDFFIIEFFYSPRQSRGFSFC